jgi:hypothetical protein
MWSLYILSDASHRLCKRLWVLISILATLLVCRCSSAECMSFLTLLSAGTMYNILYCNKIYPFITCSWFLSLGSPVLYVYENVPHVDFFVEFKLWSHRILVDSGLARAGLTHSPDMGSIFHLSISNSWIKCPISKIDFFFSLKCQSQSQSRTSQNS